MSDLPRKAPNRELLLDAHEFPGEYVVKAFGPALGDFEARMQCAVELVIARENARFSSRRSAGGNRLCVTVCMEIQTVDEVIAVYEEIHRIETLLLIL